MTQRRLIILLVSIFIISIIIILLNTRSRVDLILTNGIVYTVDQKSNISEAIAIKGNLIEVVGSSKEINDKFISENVIDLAGRAVYPGFIDSHAHMVGTGTIMMTLNLTHVKSPDEILEMVKAKIQETGNDRWVRGRGWNQNLWPSKKLPTALMLDKVAPETPVILERIDGNAVWVNSVVMKLARITKETRDPVGGKIVRDEKGNPAGMFIDNAISLVEEVVPLMNDAEVEDAIRKAIQQYVSVGVTEVHDMGVTSQIIKAYKKLIDSGNFPFRVYAAIDYQDDAWGEYKRKGPEINYGNSQLTVRGVELYIDGTLESRSAALIEPYTDDPTSRGFTAAPSDTLRAIMNDAVRAGFQVMTHAVGDRANNMLLNLYEEVLKENPERAKDARLRDEHAQILDCQDISRFSNLGIIPSMQPIHCTSDMYWAEARLGPKRLEYAYAWQSLLQSGCIIPAGSDSPAESSDPILGFYAAVTRQDINGKPVNWRDVQKGFQYSSEGIGDTARFSNGWFPDQKMTRDQALRAYTIWGAYAAFQENIKGSIEKGKLADIVVLNQDIMKIPTKEIPSTEVFLTIVGGDLVFGKLQSKNH